MIKLDELYKITVVPTNIEHYRQFFPNIKMRDKIEVNGEQLSESSHTKIKYICDFCGDIYERVKCSELRSGLKYNACKKCRSLKTQLTCQERYGVSHPMQDFEIHKRSVENHINNFGKEYNSCNFINGVPASKVQIKLGEELKDFILNYKEDGYYYDLFNNDLNLVIEYDGKGHDLEVRRGKISYEEFNKKQQKRKERIMLKHKLLIISDPYDRLIHQQNFLKALLLIRQSLKELKNYDIIQIE